jgi:hypothetical protein
MVEATQPDEMVPTEGHGRRGCRRFVVVGHGRLMWSSADRARGPRGRRARRAGADTARLERLGKTLNFVVWRWEGPACFWVAPRSGDRRTTIVFTHIFLVVSLYSVVQWHLQNGPPLYGTSSCALFAGSLPLTNASAPCTGITHDVPPPPSPPLLHLHPLTSPPRSRHATCPARTARPAGARAPRPS